MGFFSRLFGGRKETNTQRGLASNAKPSNPQTGPDYDFSADYSQMMISQLAAFYVYQKSEFHKKLYLEKLNRLGFNKEEAEKLLDFECDILKRFNKEYLLDENFTKTWLFDLDKPFFRNYPKYKDDIYKEHFLTLSELCKIIDEAEWHYWNSHERNLSNEVWNEICAWRLKGKGAEFAIGYFEMVSFVTDIPEEKIAEYSSNEGKHLDINKWSKKSEL